MAESSEGIREKVRGRLAEWIIEDWITEHRGDDPDFDKAIDKILKAEFEPTNAWLEFNSDGLEFQLTVGVNWSGKDPIKIPFCICENAVGPLRELLADVSSDEHVWLGRDEKSRRGG